MIILCNHIKTKTTNKKFGELIDKEIILNHEIKVVVNGLVDKIVEKKKIIFYNRIETKKRKFENEMKQIDNGMKQKYDTTEAIHFIENGIQVLLPSLKKLKEWSGEQKCSIIYNSETNEGEVNVMKSKVMNRKNLYFISFDNKKNVFKGYVNTVINKTEEYMTDPNSFVFSLIRNGQLKNMRYLIKIVNKSTHLI